MEKSYQLDPETTPEQKLEKFRSALGDALKVSKSELDGRLKQEKRTKARRKRHTKTSSSGHASSESR